VDEKRRSGRFWTGQDGFKTARSPVEAATCSGNRLFKRRGRDLNPRGACTPNGFRDRYKSLCLQVFFSVRQLVRQPADAGARSPDDPFRAERVVGAGRGLKSDRNLCSESPLTESSC
jgi:hypothetical protein